MYKLSNQVIAGKDFYHHFESIMMNSSKDDRTEFYDVCGRQHYRLLSHMSQQFNDSIIIDIGTHRGQSALALSYNPSNTVYTFDIEDKVYNDKIKNVENIVYQTDNLFENEGRMKWKDTILKSSFIFLDVDPHNGDMEMDFYSYLELIEYKGFVICDDIWHFKEMRDNFWYKIPSQNRYDVTEVGHYSGTGIFTFTKEITFEVGNINPQGDFISNQTDTSKWTLVTAYFNLTKYFDASTEIMERDATYYMSHSMSTLHLPYNLVIYCDMDSIHIIQQTRPAYLKDKTRYVIRNFNDIEIKGRCVRDLRHSIIENRIKNPYMFDNRNTASYYLFCMTRYTMLREVIAKNYFESTHFCWINFCIERMGISNVYRLPEALSLYRNKFSTCYIDYIPYELILDTKEYFFYGRCSMCSGFFTGNAHYMDRVCDLLQTKFIDYLELGYGHADEQLYSPVYFENPDLFEHYYGDYNQMITNYKHIYENHIAPVRNFLHNSFQSGNYKKCLEACLCLLTSHRLKTCTYDKDTLEHIHDLYNRCSDIVSGN